MSDLKGKNTEIEFIPGSNKYLLIAPHGVYKDDDNTGELVRLVQKATGCYAIINEKYRKNKKDEKVNKEKGIVNLNRLYQVKTHLKTEFLEPLLGFVDEIVKKHQTAFLIWVHGIADRHIKNNVVGCANDEIKDVKIVIGWGQSKEGDEIRNTASEQTVNNLKDVLTKEGLKSAFAKPSRVGYSGWNTNNMNQLFRAGKYRNNNVESVQLEFIKNGCRDNNENLTKTSEVIKKALFPENIVEIIDNDVDLELVEKAQVDLSTMVQKHFHDAMLEAGEYLIENFYDGKIELARNNKPRKKSSLNLLAKRLKQESDKNPSKSWLYNAVNLVVQEHDLKNNKCFQTYGKLNNSHKVNLLPVKDIDKKEELINEIDNKKLTARESKKIITESIRKPETNKQRLKLNSVINKPDILFSDEYKEDLKPQSLKESTKGNLTKLKTKALSKRENLEKELEAMKDTISKYAKLINNIDKAIEKQK